MAECIDSVSFAYCFFFRFSSIPYVFATPLFTSERIPSTLTCHFLFSSILLPYKKNCLKTQKNPLDGVKRRQTDPVVTKYQHSTFTSLHFLKWN